ncbi:hypothetical protein Psta_3410 [Pirellula staleyi DSM 6068]|uniref:Uncharacterized protein n=1 Tax=Pirellula staleyi (strain ATCC 27377 / DSM 6068 / ICPB 4128) TaxID=530564 RepID=D2QXZ7_PIRSD|nr:hypothetical protein [Pirellula staleyi]ADB18074.1 hypothetical protein Psta_3410 [Pirellula staleyi DSM 6068]
MTQAELNQAVAEATGESVRTVSRRGFSIISPLQVFPIEQEEENLDPNTVDWDMLDLARGNYAA